MSSEQSFTIDLFHCCVKKILEISDKYQDGWSLQLKDGIASAYITKKSRCTLEDPDKKLPLVIVTFDYHVVYHPSYCVPVLAFNVWKQDGTFLALEEFWKYNHHFRNSNMFDTLTQLDHPVLQRPFLTLHPCRTKEIIEPFLEHSKNPVISWLSTVGHFVYLDLLQEYLKSC
ncbi:hypothetical protein HHI36_008988 [Cryptolaemus montrouzieri]|uniref:Ubiquitin-like-conjugating enzyme ATG10 n=1 Tax=Cryptolaemus montrouzieri TaxID=559131 RepID=A0ABD2MU35_9CUCU